MVLRSPSISRERTQSAVPSPMFMPFRLRWKGRQGSWESTPRDSKPATAMRLSVSVPATTTASQMPDSMSLAAEMNARADEEQAVATVYTGPPAPVIFRKMPERSPIRLSLAS